MRIRVHSGPCTAAKGVHAPLTESCLSLYNLTKQDEAWRGGAVTRGKEAPEPSFRCRGMRLAAGLRCRAVMARVLAARHPDRGRAIRVWVAGGRTARRAGRQCWPRSRALLRRRCRVGGGVQAFGGGSGSYGLGNYGLGSVLLGIAQLATASASAARRQ